MPASAIYRLSVISKHSATPNQSLFSYDLAGERRVGVLGGERYAIRLENLSSQKIQVRLSIDGTDVLTGQPATTDATGQMFVVQANRGYGQQHVLELEAWPEGQRGGGRFVFTENVGSTVAANTHGVTSAIGVIAAAIFVEGSPPPAYSSRSPLRSFGGVRGQSLDDERFATKGGSSFGGGGGFESNTGGDGRDYEGALESRGIRGMAPVGTGVGEYVDQHIGRAEGLRLPKFSEVVSLRTVAWDDLVAALRDAGVPPTVGQVHPGFPGDNFQGINLTGVPRQGRHAPVPTYRRIG